MNTLIFLRITIFLLIIFTIISLFRIKEEFNRVNDESVINFLRNPGEQVLCPHMPGNTANRTFTIPGLGYNVKLCCSGCFSSILEGINNDRIYSIREFNLEDIDELEKYHMERSLEFTFPSLNQYLGRLALYKNDMPVQLLIS